MIIVISNTLLYIIHVVRGKFSYNMISYNANSYNVLYLGKMGTCQEVTTT